MVLPCLLCRPVRQCARSSRQCARSSRQRSAACSSLNVGCRAVPQIGPQSQSGLVVSESPSWLRMMPQWETPIMQNRTQQVKSLQATTVLRVSEANKQLAHQARSDCCCHACIVGLRIISHRYIRAAPAGAFFRAICVAWQDELRRFVRLCAQQRWWRVVAWRAPITCARRRGLTSTVAESAHTRNRLALATTSDATCSMRLATLYNVPLLQRPTCEASMRRCTRHSSCRTQLDPIGIDSMRRSAGTLVAGATYNSNHATHRA